MMSIHPGEILAEELKSRGMTVESLAEAVDIPVEALRRIVAQTAAIDARTADHIADYLGTTPEFWTLLQTIYDKTMAEEE